MYKKFLVLCAFLVSTAVAQNPDSTVAKNPDSTVAQNPNSEFGGRQENSDMSALRQWIKDKHMITVKELGGDLSISGEVRTEYQATFEKVRKKTTTPNGKTKITWVQQRGPHSTSKKPTNAFDVEVNLMMDYQAKRTWGRLKLEFDNDCGTASGTVDHIALEKAFFGGRIIDGNSLTLDLEFGRRNFSNVFDSVIEFSSIYDGILVKFSKVFDSIGDFYINGGPFIINERRNRFGYVAEMGMLDIGHSGVYLKYSIIDWMNTRYSPMKEFNYWDYLISQGILGYQYVIPSINQLIKVYAAFLYNHAAKPTVLTNHKAYGIGWYAGVAFGQIRKKNDVAIEINYQYVQPQAIPDIDVNGIKRGNADAIGFYNDKVDPKKWESNLPEFTDSKRPVGNCNYQGPYFSVLFAFSNNLTWQNTYQFSWNAVENVGPYVKYQQFESELIYAF